MGHNWSFSHLKSKKYFTTGLDKKLGKMSVDKI
jgi:hypothetical protein